MPDAPDRAPDRSDPVYKIAEAAAWAEAERAGSFPGAPVDRRDGFIHLSTAAQVRATAAKHFAGRNGLVLVAIDGKALSALGGAYRFEPSRGGDLFPHLYAPLPMGAVLWVEPLPLGPNGAHRFPRGL